MEDVGADRVLRGHKAENVSLTEPRQREEDAATAPREPGDLGPARRLRLRPRGYWRRGKDWWTEAEEEDSLVPGNAEHVVWGEDG